MRFLSLLLLLISSISSAATKPAGVRGDGTTDDTKALQAALSALEKTGGVVELPSAQYLIKGSLRIPTGVTLKGSWEAPHHGAYDKGTTLLLTGGRGKEGASPAIYLEQSSAIKGLTLLWPEQKWPNIVPYPWAIQGVGMHNTIENVTFVNAYNGIKLGGIAVSELHVVRNVFGCVLRRGIFVDATTDIGRLENVHFNPHYWVRSHHPSVGKAGDLDVAGYMMANLEGFIFGRTDWEEVTNCFVFGAKIGYRFIRTSWGACNGQFNGIGADSCRTAVQIDELQRLGIQIVNGTFAASGGPPGIVVVTTPMAGGVAQFLNCNLWEAPGGAAKLDGLTTVSFSNCQIFCGSKDGAIRATQGWLSVRGCTFEGNGISVAIGPEVKSAIITENMQQRGFRVKNQIGERAQIGLNEAPPRQDRSTLYGMIAAGVIVVGCAFGGLSLWRKFRRARAA